MPYGEAEVVMGVSVDPARVQIAVASAGWLQQQLRTRPQQAVAAAVVVGEWLMREQQMTQQLRPA